MRFQYEPYARRVPALTAVGTTARSRGGATRSAGDRPIRSSSTSAASTTACWDAPGCAAGVTVARVERFDLDFPGRLRGVAQWHGGRSEVWQTPWTSSVRHSRLAQLTRHSAAGLSLPRTCMSYRRYSGHLR